MRAAPPIRPPGDLTEPMVRSRRALTHPRGAAPPGRDRPLPGVGGGPLGGEGAVVVDPRFSARRIEVLRSEGRRRLRRLLWLGGAVSLVVAVLVSTRTPLLDVDHLRIEGMQSLDRAVLEDAAARVGLRPGTPLLDVDLGGAERALETLPAVADAEISRQWPGTVVLEVLERQPVAAVAVADGVATVAADGVVVAVGDAASAADLVTIEGPADLRAGDRLEDPGPLAVAAALPDALRLLVGGIATTDDGAVELRLLDGAVVRLGAADQLAAKLVSAETVLTQVDPTCLATVDVRVPSAPTVTRQSGCA